MIVKPLGSSGVADPLDQRQSVGFRVDGFGLAIKRPEAVCITYGLCRNAALAALAYSTADAMYGQYELMHNEAEATDVNYINETANVQVKNVDGVNGMRVFVDFDATVNYSEGDMVKYTAAGTTEPAFYVFLKGHKAGDIASNFSNGELTEAGKKLLKKINTVIF
jgi:hypothetical protein